MIVRAAAAPRAEKQSPFSAARLVHDERDLACPFSRRQNGFAVDKVGWNLVSVDVSEVRPQSADTEFILHIVSARYRGS